MPENSSLSAAGASAAAPVTPRPRPWWRLPTRSIVGIGLALLIVSSGLFAFYADQQRRLAIREAVDEVQNLALLLAEHAQRFLDASHLVTSTAMMLVSDRPWDEIRESRENHEFLRRLPENFPYIEAVGLVDQAGNLKLTSRSFPAPPTAMSDREHFRVQRDTDVGPYVSRLTPGYATGRPNIYLSRRINDSEGRFRGIATAVIDPRSLYAFYGSLKPELPIVIDLFRADLATLIRYPLDPPVTLGDKWNGVNHLAGRPEGGVLRDVRENGVRRIESFVKVGDLPVYAGVSVAWDAVNDAWRKALLPGAIFAGVAVLLMLGVLAAALVPARKEEAAVAALRELAESLEDRVRERTHELARTSEQLAQHLHDKEELARETNHRVKNSLQLVGALLRLQGKAADDPKIREQLEEASNRVATIAHVHDKLYRSEDLSSIAANEYLSALCDDLGRALIGGEHAVRLSSDFAPVRLIADKAILFGLVVSELVTNAARCGFRRRSGEIRVRLAVQAEGLVLTVFDNGDNDSDAPRGTGFGISVVSSLVDQLEGTLERAVGPEGTTVTVTILKKA
jgi:two-component sensor histidine kinase